MFVLCAPLPPHQTPKQQPLTKLRGWQQGLRCLLLDRQHSWRSWGGSIWEQWLRVQKSNAWLLQQKDNHRSVY